MIRVLIVDDEPIARDTARLVLAADPEIAITGACSGVDAAAAVAAGAPDVLLLDVQMPGVDGFDVLDAIGPDAVPAIVFVTAHDRYAVRAFEVHALDYVLKPFSDRRLLVALGRARQRLAEAGSQRDQLIELIAERAERQPRLERFVVRERGRTVLIDAGDVERLQAADDYVELHVGGAVHIVRERLAELEARLDPRFVRIHRSTIVSLARIRELRPLVRGDALVVLASGATLRLSRSRRAELLRRLSGSPSQRDGSPQNR